MGKSISLWDTQLADLVFYIQNPICINGSDPGTGKTPSVCVNQYRRASTDVGRTIWVQPKSLLKKNKRELLRFTDFGENDAQIIDGTKAQIDRAMRHNPGVLLMGPDRFKLMAGQIPPAYNCLDVDEIHMAYGGAKSGRTAAFLNHKTKECVMMSGTLINGRLDTAWPAFHKIDPRYYPFGIDSFMNHHAIFDDLGKVLFWRNHHKLAKILGKHGIRRTFDQVYGKQEVVIQVQEVDLSEKQRKRYEEFEESAVIELDDVIIDGLEGGATQRARAIMEHPRHFHDPRFPGQTLDIVDGELTAKEEALLVHFEDHLRTGKPLIVFAALRPQQKEILRLAQASGLTACLIDSDTSAMKRGQLDEDFRAGKYQVMIGSAQIASVGYNWQFWGPSNIEVDHVIFASTNYMDGDFGQAYKRAIRGRRSGPLRVTLMRYVDTLEHKIHAIICRKSREAHKVDPTREVFTFA